MPVFVNDSESSLALLLGLVKIIPCKNSRTFVNGKLVTESTVLRSGKDRITFLTELSILPLSLGTVNLLFE